MVATRGSLHRDPTGLVDTTRHYLRDLIYGANDGIITTFAVVAGVAGGSLSTAAVLVIGAANLAADGVAMGVGNLLAIRAHESALAADGRPEEETYPWKHGLATLLAFVAAGVLSQCQQHKDFDRGSRSAAGDCGRKQSLQKSGSLVE